LHHAAIDGVDDVAEVLLDGGADPNALDAQQWTPLHFAARAHHVALAEMLLRRGASIDAVDSFGNTPLFRATFDSKGRGEMIAMLLRAGANPNHANKRGVSPAKLAATIANYDVNRWFHGA
jgi:ankyrin repeat protein